MTRKTGEYISAAGFLLTLPFAKAEALPTAANAPFLAPQVVQAEVYQGTQPTFDGTVDSLITTVQGEQQIVHRSSRRRQVQQPELIVSIQEDLISSEAREIPSEEPMSSGRSLQNTCPPEIKGDPVVQQTLGFSDTIVCYDQEKNVWYYPDGNPVYDSDGNVLPDGTNTPTKRTTPTVEPSSTTTTTGNNSNTVNNQRNIDWTPGLLLVGSLFAAGLGYLGLKAWARSLVKDNTPRMSREERDRADELSRIIIDYKGSHRGSASEFTSAVHELDELNKPYKNSRYDSWSISNKAGGASSDRRSVEDLRDQYTPKEE